ncbi:Cytochrome c-type biogenesis protein Ccs1/ResB [Olavius sp. associated proteobacterium Delta 1]|nr:Cytochrome c-type biogenesis protein Ccs1/ResB [Olavius sp. associated proteobacterium Delta 1]
MSNQVISADPFSKIWNFFTSVKLTIVLLLSLAITSIIGTLIPQNEDPQAYFEAFGGVLYQLFNLLDLFDMYHSWWFQLLIVLLTANIIVCSIDRISSNRRILFVRNPSFRLPRFRNLKHRQEFTNAHTPQQLKDIFQAFIARRFRHSQVEATENGFAIYGEKGRWTRFGVYTVHLSVVLLLIGGLIGSIFGFDGFVNIAEGESVNQIRLRNKPQMVQLDFAIRCDDFDVSFYDTGAPKEFRSSLTVLEQGRPVLNKDIIVNDPLRYKGISFYQASYGNLPSNEAVLSFTNNNTGKVYKNKATMNQPMQLPENLGTFEIKNFLQSSEFRGHNIGEAYIGVLTPPGGDPVQITLPLRFPTFDKMRKGNLVIAVVEHVPRFYTGLQVGKDPGVWVVYSGFILMIIGCYITFFMSHQQICLEIVAAGQKSRVIVAGTANKNKTGMETKVDRLTEKLTQMV